MDNLNSKIKHKVILHEFTNTMIDAILIPFQNFLYPTFFLIRIGKKKENKSFDQIKIRKEKKEVNSDQ